MAKRSKQPRPPMGGGGMMKQIQQLQEQLLAAQESLADETISASAGGGVVKATVTGDQQLQAIEIDPSVLEDGDVEMLQDLILTAINSAMEQSRELAGERLGPLTGGLPF
jgi:nucleoid-associated protein EbfC